MKKLLSLFLLMNITIPAFSMEKEDLPKNLQSREWDQNRGELTELKGRLAIAESNTKRWGLFTLGGVVLTYFPWKFNLVPKEVSYASIFASGFFAAKTLHYGYKTLKANYDLKKLSQQSK